ncbi:MAG: peptidylprolyl isomerase [Lachnospiraceae bacterium]|nr:peptidylprolyl isomerase [Lachnospiraceae bacterium]
MSFIYEWRRYIAAAAVIIMIALTAGGCGLMSDKSGDDDTHELTTSFLEDTVFTVSDVRVSLTEWYLYALRQIADIEAMYGEDIWDFKVDTEGKTMWDAVKDDIMEQIIYIKIVCARAGELGITINEDDQLNINLQTDEFMTGLSAELKNKYGITQDIVKAIYTDNVLAMKVYENLTLNIDTNIPDVDVRHMVLDYISVLKYYENDDEDAVSYTDEELAQIKADAEEYLAAAKANPDITRLAEINDDRYSVVELVADYAELKEKLPDDIPDKAYSLREGEISGLYETEDAYFILDCVKYTDEESTNAARIRIIEERQKALFEEKYTAWEAETVIKTNYKVWDAIVRE